MCLGACPRVRQASSDIGPCARNTGINAGGNRGQSEPIKSLVRRPTLLSPAQPQQQPVCAFAVLLLVYNLAQEAIDDGPEQGNNQLITIDFGGIVMGRKECVGC